jgi:hypothetical protein
MPTEEEEITKIIAYLEAKSRDTMQKNLNLEKPGVPDIYDIERSQEDIAANAATFILTNDILLAYGLDPDSISDTARRNIEPVIE